MNNPGRNCTVDCPVIISRLWLLFTSKCFMWRGSSVIIVEKIGQTGPQQCPFVTMHWVRWMTQRHMAFISAHWTADFFRKLLLSSRSRGSMIRPGFTRFTHKYDESCQKKNRHCVIHEKKAFYLNMMYNIPKWNSMVFLIKIETGLQSSQTTEHKNNNKTDF